MNRRSTILYISITCLSGMNASANADSSPIDPSQYLKNKAIEDDRTPPNTEAVKQAFVQIDGRPYYKFASESGAVFVPKLDHLSKEDLERAICAEDLKEVCDPNKGSPDDPKRTQLCDMEGVKEALIAKAEMMLSDRTALYLGLIQKTIKTTCGGEGKQPNAKDLLFQRLVEIGIERTSTDPRHPGSEKVFIRPMLRSPEIGVGINF